MKLSTKGRYGIKAMVDLAVSYSCGCRLSIAQLADKQGISAAYLEQLIGTLKKAGLVTASRGSQGGYSLARAPELISVGDVKAVRPLSTASAPTERTAPTSAPVLQGLSGSSFKGALTMCLIQLQSAIWRMTILRKLKG